MSITEKGAVSTVEEACVEDETEADALDDFDNGSGETKLDDFLDHKDDE